MLLGQGLALATPDNGQFDASDTAAGDRFGWSMDLAGDDVIVGAPFHGGEGAAYRFTNEGGVWVERMKLSPLDLEANDEFGKAVAMEKVVVALDEVNREVVIRTMVAVGAPQDDDAAANAGAVYVYEEGESGEWTFLQKLLPPSAQTNNRMGTHVTMSGRWLVCGGGVPFGKGNRVYFYERDEVTGLYVSRGFQAVSVFDDLVALAMEDDWVAAGSEDGKVTLFYFDGVSWSKEQELTIPDGMAVGFGRSVSIGSNLLAVGAPSTSHEGVWKGNAYVYRLEDTGWVAEQTLDEFNRPGSLREYGRTVKVHRNQLYVGAPDALTDRVFRYGRSGSGSWTLRDVYTSSDGTLGSNLGSSIATSDDYLLIGGSGDDDAGGDSGTVGFYTGPVVLLRGVGVSVMGRGRVSGVNQGERSGRVAPKSGYAEGEWVRLTVDPDPGWVFGGWEGEVVSGATGIFVNISDGEMLQTAQFDLPEVTAPESDFYFSWANAYFPGEADEVAAADADADGDGLSNLMEFLLGRDVGGVVTGLDPRVASPVPYSMKKVVEDGLEYLAVSCVVRKEPEIFPFWNVAGVSSVSLEDGSWSETRVVARPAVSVDENYEEREFRVPMDQGQEFLRLELSYWEQPGGN